MAGIYTYCVLQLVSGIYFQCKATNCFSTRNRNPLLSIRKTYAWKTQYLYRLEHTTKPSLSPTPIPTDDAPERQLAREVAMVESQITWTACQDSPGPRKYDGGHDA